MISALYRLGDICKVSTGQSAPQDESAFGQEGYPFVRAGSLEQLVAGGSESELEKISLTKAELHRLRLFPAGTIVFAKSGMSAKLSRVHVLTQSCYVVSHLATIEPSEKVNGRYLYHWLIKNPPSNLISNDSYPSIRTSEIESLKIGLPSLEKQLHVANVLDCANNIVLKKRVISSHMEDLINSVFYEMFGDAKNNIKELPKFPLGELVRLKSGEFLPSHKMDMSGETFVYGGNGINGKHNVTMFEEVKLVIGRVGAYCGVVHLTEPNNWITDNALYVSEMSSDLRLEYLAFALKQANLNQYSSQSGQPLVSASRLYPIDIIVPKVQDQDKFISFLRWSKKINENMKTSYFEVDALIDSLSHSYFS